MSGAADSAPDAAGGGESLWKAIGPGVLFTGAAVGVSHLVQSTRAGAEYGFALWGFVLLALLMKYPAFRFGPEYTAATGWSLLEGYRRQGRWALALYGLLTLGTMFTVQAAVTVVTAGLLMHLLGIQASPVVVSAGLLAVCAAMVTVGSYRWLDRIAKVVVAVLSLSTVAATLLALPSVPWGEATLFPTAEQLSPASLMFVAALVGWMPSAVDVAVWQSLWTLARAKESGQKAQKRGALLDFHVGYIWTGVLAFFFLLLGAAVMRGQELSPQAGAFAAQLVDLYGQTLGGWSRPIIAVCAFLTMFSTTLTVVDGFPRALGVLSARFRRPEDPSRADEEERETRKVYLAGVAVLGVGSVVVLATLMASLKSMVDLATTLSFLTAPILSALNHRAIQAPEVPEAARPSRGLAAASLASIFAQGAFAMYYIWLRFLT